MATLNGSRGASYAGTLAYLYGLSYLWPLLWPFIITIIIIFFIHSIKNQYSLLKGIKIILQNKWAIFFFIVALSAFLPVLLSPRQSPHYFIPALPFFALAFAQIVTPIYVHWISFIKIEGKKYTEFLYIMICISILAFVGMIFSIGKVNYFQNRDFKELMSDSLLIAKFIPRGTEIFTDDSAITSNIDNIAILNRYGHIRIESGSESKNYVLKTNKNSLPPAGYESINIGLQKLSLFKKKFNLR